MDRSLKYQTCSYFDQNPNVNTWFYNNVNIPGIIFFNYAYSLIKLRKDFLFLIQNNEFWSNYLSYLRILWLIKRWIKNEMMTPSLTKMYEFMNKNRETQDKSNPRTLYFN